MILSGKKISEEIILGNIQIDNFDHAKLNPNSYNLTLAPEIVTYLDDTLDLAVNNEYRSDIIPETGYELLPGKIYLCRTNERTFTDKYVPMLEGRSSTGRKGLFVHATAGFGDVGFGGFWTLELSVVQKLIIYPHIDICQIFFHTIEGDTSIKYEGKYQKNRGIQPSMMYKEFDENKKLIKKE